MEEDDIARVIRKMLLLRGPGATVAATDIARAMAGKDARKWRHLMNPIKDVAVKLARDGEIVIKRKGKITDPGKLKGVYRIGLPPRAEAMPVPEPRHGDEAPAISHTSEPAPDEAG